jgi:hypothetical protein
MLPPASCRASAASSQTNLHRLLLSLSPSDSSLLFYLDCIRVCAASRSVFCECFHAAGFFAFVRVPPVVVPRPQFRPSEPVRSPGPAAFEKSPKRPRELWRQPASTDDELAVSSMEWCMHYYRNRQWGGHSSSKKSFTVAARSFGPMNPVDHGALPSSKIVRRQGVTRDAGRQAPKKQPFPVQDGCGLFTGMDTEAAYCKIFPLASSNWRPQWTSTHQSRMDGEWWGNSFLLGSCSLASHGG